VSAGLGGGEQGAGRARLAGHGVVEAAGDPPADQAGVVRGADREQGRGGQGPARGGEELVEQGGDPGGGEAGGPGLLEQGGGAAVGDQAPQGPRAPADPSLGQAGDQRPRWPSTSRATAPGPPPGGAAGSRSATSDGRPPSKRRRTLAAARSGAGAPVARAADRGRPSVQAYPSSRAEAATARRSVPRRSAASLSWRSSSTGTGPSRSPAASQVTARRPRPGRCGRCRRRPRGAARAGRRSRR
jgi:hypothetical protein